MPSKSLKATLFLTVFIYLVGFGMIIPLIPLLSRDFGATSFQSGLLMAVFSLMQFLFAPFWGRLSDRLGRRPVLLFCLFGETLAYVVFALSRSLEMLIVSRVLAGFFGASISTASAYMSDITSQENRSQGMALIGAAFGLGFLCGPALGALLAHWAHSLSSAPFFDTSFVGFGIALVCFGNLVFSYFKLKESLTPENRRPTQKSQSRWQQLFQAFNNRTRFALLGGQALVVTSMGVMEASIVLYMADEFGWGVREAGFGFSFIGVCMIFTQGFLVRRLMPLLGERRVLMIGLAVFLVGMLLLPGQSVALVGISMSLISVGMGLINPSILGSVSLLSKAEEQGERMGVSHSMSALGRILGPALGGWLYGYHSSSPFQLSSALILIAIIWLTKEFKNLPESGRKGSL